MIGFEGRHQWRRKKLFKLHAKLVQRKKRIIYKGLDIPSGSSPNFGSHPKFAIRSFVVRRTRNEQMLEMMPSDALGRSHRVIRWPTTGGPLACS
jgi:hypothetical protein